MSKEKKLYTQGDIEELNKTIIDNNCEIILKDQRIAELEKLLAEKDKLLENAIVLPYKVNTCIIYKNKFGVYISDYHNEKKAEEALKKAEN